jgi:two-component system NarL family response regulator
METKLQLLIIDDHVMLREGLVSLFQKQPDFEVIGHGGSVAEAIQLSGELNPDLILMDYYLPDGTGVDAIKTIVAAEPDVLIVMLTHTEDDDMIYEAIKSGAKGCLLKSQPAMELVNSLRRVMKGDAILTKNMTNALVDRIAQRGVHDESVQMHPAVKLLTNREKEILLELVTDATNQEIALKLGISIYTVKNHVSSILSKLELRNRREAATFARNYNIQ